MGKKKEGIRRKGETEVGKGKEKERKEKRREVSRYWLVVTSSPSPSAESDFPLFFFVPFIPSEENFVRQRAEDFFYESLYVVLLS